MRHLLLTGLVLSSLGWGGRLAAAEDKGIHPELLRRFEARTHRGPDGTVLNYRLYRPTRGNPSPATNLPLVLVLHGAAGLGDDNRRQFNGGNEVPPLALTADDTQARFPSFVLMPQCPRGESWSGPGREPARMLRLTLAVLDRLQAEFRLDATRLYLVGISMGGVGAWDAAGKLPDKFAAVVPICGAGNPDIAARIVRLPLWCFHGEADPLIPVERARQMVAAVRKAGGNPRYTEYPGVGHDSYRKAFQEPDLLPWLFAQRLRGAAAAVAPAPAPASAPTSVQPAIGGAGRR